MEEKDAKGHTPLAVALRVKNYEMADALIHHGALAKSALQVHKLIHRSFRYMDERACAYGGRNGDADMCKYVNTLVNI